MPRAVGYSPYQGLARGFQIGLRIGGRAKERRLSREERERDRAESQRRFDARTEFEQERHDEKLIQRDEDLDRQAARFGMVEKRRLEGMRLQEKRFDTQEKRLSRRDEQAADDRKRTAEHRAKIQADSSERLKLAREKSPTFLPKTAEKFRLAIKRGKEEGEDTSGLERQLKHIERIMAKETYIRPATTPANPQLKKLMDLRDALPEGHPDREIYNARISKLTSSTGRTTRVNPDGSVEIVEGPTEDLTKKNVTDAQKYRAAGEELVLELNELSGKLSSSDVGLRGWLGEVINEVGAQFAPGVFDKETSQNRAFVRAIREKGLGLMKKDGRFQRADRAAIEKMFPKDGFMESLPAAKSKMQFLSTLISDRISTLTGALTDRKPITEMSPDEIAQAFRDGKIDKRTAGRALKYLHLDFIKKRK